MRQFQVPQFIMVEDKVIGPFSIKQFLFLGGGALLIVAAHTLFAGLLFYLATAIIASFAGSLAFLKINEQPFPVFLKNATFYLLRPRLYIWKKEVATRPPAAAAPGSTPDVLVQSIPKLSQSKLSDLAWSLDLKERSERNS